MSTSYSIGFVAFEGMTALDLIGVYDPLTRLKSMGFMADLRWRICAMAPEVSDDRGLRLSVDLVQPDLGQFDLLVVPGGHATRRLRADSAFLAWLRSAEPVPLKASVCTGALLLAAAGWLAGRAAATHPGATNMLSDYGVMPRSERVVDIGDVVTCGGVTAGLDLGLHLVARLKGMNARAAIAAQMDYPG